MSLPQQSIGILFNAAGIAAGLAKPPFHTKIQGKNSLFQVFDILTIDATLQETHTAAAEVTEHPVEVGSDITDHVRPKPIELRIDGIVTNAPLQTDLLSTALAASPLAPGLAVAGAAAQALIGRAEFIKDAYNTLMNIRDTGQLVVIATPYRQYESMVMTDLQVVRDQKTGDALRFQISFRQIVVVEGAKTITLPAMAQDGVNLGTQSTSAVGGAVKKAGDSILLQGIKATDLGKQAVTAVQRFNAGN